MTAWGYNGSDKTKRKVILMNYTFNSIAGFEEEKNELKRLSEILNNREKYEAKGGRMPRGVVMYGAPGNGKTLFAKVLAGECKLKMININLGQCSSTAQVSQKIQSAFQEARAGEEPAMVFFDELDKVLPNDYEEYYTEGSKNILVQLLTLIDGIDSSKNTFFVATCNNYNALPKALVRAGRIDKKISIGNPTYNSRVEILKYYMKKTRCKISISIDEMARLTNGMTSAELEMLINECVLSSNEKNYVPTQVVKGKLCEIRGEDIERRDSALTNLIFACRNVGAFAVARTFNSGGYVLSLDKNTVCNNFYDKILSDYNCDYDCDDDESGDEESTYFSNEDLKNAITVVFGGYAAQELILGRIYDNVRNQLEITDDIVDGMVECGMLGILNRYNSNRYVPYTPERLEAINQEADNIIESCYLQAKEIVKSNEGLLKLLIPIVVEKNSITKNECERIIKQYNEEKSHE